VTEGDRARRRGYLETRRGQVHYRRAGYRAPRATALVCLHPTPFSSRFYAEFQKAAASVETFALDTPGFGESDPVTTVSIEALAAELAEALGGLEGAVDVLGFHTGCLLGLEIASAAPERIRRLVLVDAPVLEAAERKVALERTLAAYEVRRARFEAIVQKRVPARPVGGIDRELELLADEVAGSAAAAAVFTAAFEYEAPRRFDRIDRPVLCVATNGPLAGPTKAVASQLRDARLAELADVSAPVFQAHAAEIAAVVMPFLKT
jgi:pimeloyl-ACP methyl ester carboxylesterase